MEQRPPGVGRVLDSSAMRSADRHRTGISGEELDYPASLVIRPIRFMLGVHYDVEVDTGVLDLNEELSVIAEALWQRWSLLVATESSPKAALPPTSAWMPEGVVRPAPWES